MDISIPYVTRGYSEVMLSDGAAAAVTHSGPLAVVDVIDEHGDGVFMFDVPAGAGVAQIRDASEDEMSCDDCERIMYAVAAAGSAT